MPHATYHTRDAVPEDLTTLLPNYPH